MSTFLVYNLAYSFQTTSGTSTLLLQPTKACNTTKINVLIYYGEGPEWNVFYLSQLDIILLEFMLMDHST